MKKDNTLLWVGIGSVLVVGVVLYFVLKPKKDKDKKDEKKDDQADVTIDDQTGNLKVGDVKIDPKKFKIDMDKVMEILKAPVSKEQKYANMKASGLSDNLISIVKKQDDLAEKKNLGDIVARLRKQELDNEFKTKYGVTPIKLPTYGIK